MTSQPRYNNIVSVEIILSCGVIISVIRGVKFQ